MEQSIAVEKFVARIKPKYIERRLNRAEKQWPPCSSEKLIRLELVEGEQRQGYSAGQTRGRSVWMHDKDVKCGQDLAYIDILQNVRDSKLASVKIVIQQNTNIAAIMH